MKLVDNASGNVSQGITLSSENKADSYKLSYNCNNIGSGNSYIRIYATLSDNSYKTYFMPIQFSGFVEFELSIDSDTNFIQFDVIGDANVNSINFETITNATMEYVKQNSTFWDRIKDVTNNTGKLRAEALEGLINLTTNAFANANGTITQENGVMTWLNGTTVANSTQAVQITGGAIRVASSKLPSGEWNWSTAINGAGINADTIVTGILRAITISGVDITGSAITGGVITGTKIQGGEIFIGNYKLKSTGDVDISSFTGTHIGINGMINGYMNGKRTYNIAHTAEGSITLGTDLDSYGGNYISINPIGQVSGLNSSHEGAIISNANKKLIVMGDIVYTGNLIKV